MEKRLRDRLQAEYDGIKEYIQLMQEDSKHCEEFKHIICEELCHVSILTKMIEELEEKK